jgi:uncharacterized protein YidB (DUF937 family)
VHQPAQDRSSKTVTANEIRIDAATPIRLEKNKNIDASLLIAGRGTLCGPLGSIQAINQEVWMGLLDGILGGGMRRGGMSPLMIGLLGLLAYKSLKGKNLSDLMGGAGAPGQGGAPGSGGLGDLLRGGLGGLLGGGAAGGILSGGLGDLLKQFQQNGQGDKADSWISSGQNQPIAPQELERALGDERIGWLMEQTGMSREELLAGLSRELPQVVDKLTPQGRLPSDQEAQRMIA